MFEQEVTPRFNIRLPMETTKVVSVRSQKQKTKKEPKSKTFNFRTNLQKCEQKNYNKYSLLIVP